MCSEPLSGIKWFVVYQVIQNSKGLKGRVETTVRAVHSQNTSPTATVFTGWLLTTCGWSMGTMWPAASTATKVIPPPLLTCPATWEFTNQSTNWEFTNADYQRTRERVDTKMVDKKCPITDEGMTPTCSIHTCPLHLVKLVHSSPPR